MGSGFAGVALGAEVGVAATICVAASVVAAGGVVFGTGLGTALVGFADVALAMGLGLLEGSALEIDATGGWCDGTEALAAMCDVGSSLIDADGSGLDDGVPAGVAGERERYAPPTASAPTRPAAIASVDHERRFVSFDAELRSSVLCNGAKVPLPTPTAFSPVLSLRLSVS